MPDTPNAHDLSGRVALVTGAGGGIGRAAALALARRGARIGVHFNSQRAAAEATLAAIRDAGSEGVLLEADLTDEAAAERIVDECANAWGRLDILFNNAGSPLERATIEDCPTALWKKVFDVNVHSAFIVTRRAIPHLRANGHGAIVNNLSLCVQTGSAAPYAAAKGALEVFTRSLARELAPSVRSNAIMPGVIETHHHEIFTTAERMDEYRRETPLGRNGLPQEVGEVVAFLASDAASFVNGALVDINGGRFLR